MGCVVNLVGGLVLTLPSVEASNHGDKKLTNQTLQAAS